MMYVRAMELREAVELALRTAEKESSTQNVGLSRADAEYRPSSPPVDTGPPAGGGGFPATKEDEARWRKEGQRR